MLTSCMLNLYTLRPLKMNNQVENLAIFQISYWLGDYTERRSIRAPPPCEVNECSTLILLNSKVWMPGFDVILPLSIIHRGASGIKQLGELLDLFQYIRNARKD